jgi:NADPH:quinone reductase
VAAVRAADELSDDFDLVVDAVGGATFAAAIEHLAPGGLVVNLATGDPDEVVSFRAARFDRSPGARIYTLNVFDELPHMGASQSLTRLAELVAQGRLSAGVELLG